MFSANAGSSGIAGDGGTAGRIGFPVFGMGGRPQRPPIGGAGRNPVGNGGRNSGGSAVAGTAGTGPIQCAEGANPCVSIPQFSGVQVVDGMGDEFCSIPAFELAFDSAARIVEYNGAFSSSRYPERAEVRVAWSRDYLHAFIRVLDPFVIAADAIDYVWAADGVELMVATDPKLTGNTADDPSTIHVIAAPWATSSLGMAVVVRNSTDASEYTPLPANTFAVVTTGQGYNVELQVPWPSATLSTPGQWGAFDFMLNAAVAGIETGSTPRDAQAVYYQGVSTITSTCAADTQPYCDDRLWCSTRFN